MSALIINMMHLKGKNVNLRKLKVSDAKTILKLAKNKEITKYTFVISPPFSLKKVKEFIRKSQQEIKKKIGYEFGIELKKDKKLIETICLSHINYKNKNANVGFWLDNKYWGRGLTKEALSLVLEFGFKELKLKRIQARVLDKNIRAQKLLEKIGFKLEGRLKKKTLFKNKWHDDLIYGILKEGY